MTTPSDNDRNEALLYASQWTTSLSECAQIQRHYLAGLAKRDEQYKNIAERLQKVLPIIEAAFWDQHTAGMMPGSGYNNRPQHEAGKIFGWQKSDTFQKWLTETKKALQPFTEETER